MFYFSHLAQLHGICWSVKNLGEEQTLETSLGGGHSPDVVMTNEHGDIIDLDDKDEIPPTQEDPGTPKTELQQFQARYFHNKFVGDKVFGANDFKHYCRSH